MSMAADHGSRREAAIGQSVRPDTPYFIRNTRYDMPVLTDQQLGIEPVERTTMGQPILKNKEVYGLPKAETAWEVFKKMWIPNFGYKGRRRLGRKKNRTMAWYK